MNNMKKLAALALAGAMMLGTALAQTGPGTSPLSVPKGGTGSTNASGARSNLGLAIGSDVQAYDADLAALAGLTSADNKCFYWIGSGAAANFDCSSYGRGLINAVDAAAARTALGSVIGTDVQAYDADLAAIAGLTSANNKCFYWTGSGTAANFDCSSYGRGLINAVDAAAARIALGSVIGTDVQAYDADLAAIASNSSNGLWARTGAGTGAARTLTAPAAGISVTNGDGVSGDPTLALANDLSALEALSGTGIARRTGTDSWSVGTAVANSELANMEASTFKCRNTASTGAPEDCTATQATAKLDAMVGDSGTGGTKGLVPAPSAGDAAADKYLKADGTWDTPSGGGGGGGMTDDERQRYALSLIYESKFLGDLRRVIKMMATGLKASTSTLRGLTTETNADVSNASASGYISPSTGVGSRITGATPTAPLGGTAANFNDDSTGTVTTTSALGNLSATAAGGRIMAQLDLGSVQTIAQVVVKQASYSADGPFTSQIYYSTDGSTWTAYSTSLTVTTTPTDFTRTATVSARYIGYALQQVNYGSAYTATISDLNVYGSTYDDMTLVTIAQTSSSSASNVRVLVEYDDSASISLNTDLTVEVTSDGGSNWASATLSSAGTGQSGRKVAETADTATTSGTSIQARVKTFNGKNIPLYGLSVTWH